jgi:Txe/YoeB family toxin of Txe-Axe toxin-antitoxin module
MYWPIDRSSDFKKVQERKKKRKKEKKKKRMILRNCQEDPATDIADIVKQNHACSSLISRRILL